MKKEMTRNEVMEFYSKLNVVVKESTVTDLKFTYALVKSKNKLESEVKATQTAMRKRTEVYDKERLELCEKMADKTVKGVAIMKEGRYQIVQQKADFDKALADLKDEHKEEIDGLEPFLEEKVTVDVHGIKEADMPKSLTPKHLDAIFGLIIMDEDEPKKEEEEKPKE